MKIADQNRDAVNDAAIIAIVNDGDGHNYVKYADGSLREMESWRQCCEAMRDAEISRKLMGLEL